MNLDFSSHLQQVLCKRYANIKKQKTLMCFIFKYQSDKAAIILRNSVRSGMVVLAGTVRCAYLYAEKGSTKNCLFRL